MFVLGFCLLAFKGAFYFIQLQLHSKFVVFERLYVQLHLLVLLHLVLKMLA